MNVFDKLQRVEIQASDNNRAIFYNGFPMIWLDSNNEWCVNSLQFDNHLESVFREYQTTLQNLLEINDIEKIYQLHSNRWAYVKNEVSQKFNNIETFNEKWDKMIEIAYIAYRDKQLDYIEECIRYLNYICGKEVITEPNVEPTLRDKLQSYFNTNVITTKELSHFLEIDSKTLTKYTREKQIEALPYKEKNSKVYSIEEVERFIKTKVKYILIANNKL